MFLVNGTLTDGCQVADRGLQYGDGVFETILVQKLTPVLWKEHLTRLEKGCCALGIPYLVDREVLLSRVLALIDLWCESHSSSDNRYVIKIIVTRGSGGRGYRPPGKVNPTEIVAVYPAPSFSSELYLHGVAVRTLKTPVSQNLLLAGHKHLNRLDQVIASAELEEDEFEGIMCLPDGQLIEGTRSNILVRIKGRWITPELSLAGVNGVVRQYLLAKSEKLGLKVEEGRLGQAELAGIQAMALMNSVFGIIPVNRFNETELDVYSVLQEVQDKIHKEIPFF
ncbi:aminodeoxychorismate lyase [Hahella ganghwensis]|uniref:aminodeoxychorismate lyase n=1 Tax=Hahella ganghwensis TaxID=286420 RepID=UPI0003655834|nr:aminodeoxychorismate lyase [Hahella ganghwensis]